MVECNYCGEAEAVDKIGNPNLDMSSDIDWSKDENWWKVCATCKRVIPLQMMSSIPDEKVQKYCFDELDKIAKEDGVPIMNARITKDKDGKIDMTSIEFTGEKE